MKTREIECLERDIKIMEDILDGKMENYTPHSTETIRINLVEYKRKLIKMNNKINHNEIFLKVWKESQLSIQDLIKEVPSTKNYFIKVAEELGCEIKDLIRLLVHPDYENYDEEGWQLGSFFPAGARMKEEVINEELGLELDDFLIGRVSRLFVGGKKFIAETNASPFIIYASNKNIVTIGTNDIALFRFDA